MEISWARERWGAGLNGGEGWGEEGNRVPTTGDLIERMGE